MRLKPAVMGDDSPPVPCGRLAAQTCGRLAAQTCGRLAPSPTGFLHLGNAWAFLWAWLACRAASGTLVLRIEDLDPLRSKAEYQSALIEDLHWLGLNWDEGPKARSSTGHNGPYVQSLRTACYEQALEKLHQQGLVYPCYCTRKELRDMAGAPHVDDIGVFYPGTCRSLTAHERVQKEAQGRRPCLRLDCSKVPRTNTAQRSLAPATETNAFAFTDLIYGPQNLTLAQCGGDFALRRSDGVFAYQLAVTVDDGLMGINQVVRGADILPSTPRQLALFDLLGLTRPRYAHIPLLCDVDGERLAKRHQSLTLRALRQQGVAPQALIGYLAWKAGLLDIPHPVAPDELLPGFALARLPRDPVRLESDPALALLRLRQ